MQDNNMENKEMLKKCLDYILLRYELKLTKDLKDKSVRCQYFRSAVELRDKEREIQKRLKLDFPSLEEFAKIRLTLNNE
jgi:hypothetical protein